MNDSSKENKVRILKMALPIVLLFLVCVAPAFAEADGQEGMDMTVTDNPADMSAEDVEDQGARAMDAFMASLDFQKGTIVLEDDLVTLNLPDTFSYLSPEDAERVLVDVWGNPPGNETLGMLFPANTSPFDMDAWAVIISYEEEGYVSDKDAEDIDYDELLDEMKKGSLENNKERLKAGYDPIEVVGWAAAPFYDKESKKLHWAKEIKFGESDVNTLNYNIRILGRKGVLILNIVAGMPQLQVINSEIPTLLSMTEFNPGQRYSDFDPKVDTIAAYGIGALIAGKVAAKAGLLAKFGGIFLAMKKFVILFFVGVVAFFKSLFGKKNKDQADSEE